MSFVFIVLRQSPVSVNTETTGMLMACDLYVLTSPYVSAELAHILVTSIILLST